VHASFLPELDQTGGVTHVGNAKDFRFDCSQNEFKPESRQALISQGNPQATNLNLYGSVIVFVCAGYPGKRFIYERARELGIISIIVDECSSWAKDLRTDGIIDFFIGVDMTTVLDTIVEDCVKQIRGFGLHPDGVCTFVELSVCLSAKLAAALGCPGPDIESVFAARDKSRTRIITESAGLPTVRHALIRSNDDLVSAAEHVGFPAVLKPVSGAASLGVKKASALEELLEVFTTVSSSLSTLVVTSGALERRVTTVCPSGNSLSPRQCIEANTVIDTTVMMEEYLEGPEVDVDMIISQGECRYCTVIDNGPTYEPYFAETWAVVPSSMDSEKVESIKKLAIDSVLALGFKNGVFHVELKYTNKGPRLLEVNARMGGYATQLIHKRCFGVDLVQEQFRIAVGLPSRPEPTSKPLVHIAYAFITCRSSGAVSDLSFMQKYLQRPHVISLNAHVKPYQLLIGPEDGHPTWIGDIVVEHPDGREALRIVQELENEIANEYRSLCIIL
jgi:carnosine synthase